jgi:hypothetical protein
MSLEMLSEGIVLLQLGQIHLDLWDLNSSQVVHVLDLGHRVLSGLGLVGPLGIGAGVLVGHVTASRLGGLVGDMWVLGLVLMLGLMLLWVLVLVLVLMLGLGLLGLAVVVAGAGVGVEGATTSSASALWSGGAVGVVGVAVVGPGLLDGDVTEDHAPLLLLEGTAVLLLLAVVVLLLLHGRESVCAGGAGAVGAVGAARWLGRWLWLTRAKTPTAPPNSCLPSACHLPASLSIYTHTVSLSLSSILSFPRSTPPPPPP